MKKLCILLSVMLVGAIASAQENVNIPNEILKAYEKDYPGLTGKWTDIGNYYTVSFSNGKKKMSILYDATGKTVETETLIKPGEFPTTALDYIEKRKMPRITEVSIILKENGDINYKAIAGGSIMIFDKDGNYMRTTNN